MRSSLFALTLLVACGHKPTVVTPPPKASPDAAVAMPAPDAEPAKPPGPPVAKVDDVVETRFGITTHDPYRWMETDDAGRSDFLRAQGDYARAWLDRMPGKEALFQRIHDLGMSTSGAGGLQLSGGRMFYTETDPGEELGKLVVRDPDSKVRVLVDPATLGTADQHASLNAYASSPDGKLIAYDLALGGGEVSQLHVMDVATGKDLPDLCDRVWGEGSAAWLPDGKSFFYEQMPVTKQGEDPWQNWVAKLHVLGTTSDQDVVILSGASAPSFALTPEELPGLWIQPGTKTVFAGAGGAFSWSRVASAPLDKLDRSGKAATKWTTIAGYDDDIESYWIHGDRLYLQTFKDASNRKIVSVPLGKPVLAKAKLEVAEDKDAPLVRVAMAKDGFYLEHMVGGLAKVTRRPWKGKAADLALPYPGWVDEIDADVLRDGATLSEEGWTQPGAFLVYDLKKKALVANGIHVETSADYSNIVAEEVDAKSADGTMVPLSILHGKDAALDGSHPAIVYAYGGYGSSQTPSFSPGRLAWLEHDGVFSVCHVRGGGEKGFQWQADGTHEHKMNGIHDLEACAQYLIDHGYTTSARVFAQGGSMGGVLLGRAVTDRPDLFAAMNIQVGILDPLRILAAENGANQKNELGDPETEAGFQSLLEMDPYQHVVDGTSYPAVLFSVGLNDKRVAPWMTAKMAARMQVATSSSQPLLVRVESDAGHGIGSTRDQIYAERADEWGFFLAIAGDPDFAVQ